MAIPMATLKVKRLSSLARLPTYGSEGAIGLDLYALLDTGIFPGERAAISTGIAVEIPMGYYGRVAPRSGWALKNGIDVLAGVIDEDYRGEVKVILINHGEGPFSVRYGDRIAQLVLERADRAEVIEVGELSPSIRGADGYGSTGR